MTNEELAGRLTAQANEASRKRRALLTVAVVLATTATIAAARRELESHGLPVPVFADAMAVLDDLAADDAGTDLDAAWQAAAAPLVPPTGEAA